MTEAENTEVQTPKGNDTQTGVKAVPAEKHAPRRLDKFAERRAAVKKQKRKAHRHSIASSNRNG
jgi:hypothetical protein